MTTAYTSLHLYSDLHIAFLLSPTRLPYLIFNLLLAYLVMEPRSNEHITEPSAPRHWMPMELFVWWCATQPACQLEKSYSNQKSHAVNRHQLRKYTSMVSSHPAPRSIDDSSKWRTEIWKRTKSLATNKLPVNFEYLLTRNFCLFLLVNSLECFGFELV